MSIKFGSIEYFELLSFRDKLKLRGLDKLDLLNLDRLRNEVETKIQVINQEQNEYLTRKKDKNEK